MRTILPNTEGMWWYRQSDDTFHKCVFLADWDSTDNYEQVTEQWKEEHEDSEITDSEITDSEALNLITEGI